MALIKDGSKYRMMVVAVKPKKQIPLQSGGKAWIFSITFRDADQMEYKVEYIGEPDAGIDQEVFMEGEFSCFYVSYDGKGPHRLEVKPCEDDVESQAPPPSKLPNMAMPVQTTISDAEIRVRCMEMATSLQASRIQIGMATMEVGVDFHLIVSLSEQIFDTLKTQIGSK